MKDALEEQRKKQKQSLQQIDKFYFAAVAQRDDLVIFSFQNMFKYTKIANFERLLQIYNLPTIVCLLRQNKFVTHIYQCEKMTD